MSWAVYIVRCADATLYTGIAVDVERRIAQHNAGSGARYTRSRRPVVLVYVEEQPDRSVASKREWAIKQLARKDKERLISSCSDALSSGCAGDGAERER